MAHLNAFGPRVQGRDWGNDASIQPNERFHFAEVERETAHNHHHLPCRISRLKQIGCWPMTMRASQPCRNGQCSADFQSISNLLYRRAPSLRDFPTSPRSGHFQACGSEIGDTAQRGTAGTAATEPREAFGASSLLALSLVVGDSKAGASSTHSNASRNRQRLKNLAK